MTPNSFLLGMILHPWHPWAQQHHFGGPKHWIVWATWLSTTKNGPEHPENSLGGPYPHPKRVRIRIWMQILIGQIFSLPQIMPLLTLWFDLEMVSWIWQCGLNKGVGFASMLLWTGCNLRAALNWARKRRIFKEEYSQIIPSVQKNYLFPLFSGNEPLLLCPLVGARTTLGREDGTRSMSLTWWISYCLFCICRNSAFPA